MAFLKYLMLFLFEAFKVIRFEFFVILKRRQIIKNSEVMIIIYASVIQRQGDWDENNIQCCIIWIYILVIESGYGKEKKQFERKLLIFLLAGV